MSIENIKNLKSHFETNDIPTPAEFGQLIDSIGHANDVQPASMATVHTTILYVDPSGNNTTAVKGDILLPYADLWAAKVAAVSGDLIMVKSGTYVIGDAAYTGDLAVTSLVKNGVTYYLEPGATIESNAVINDMPLIYDVTGATCSFKGHGIYKQTNQSGVGIAFYPRLICIDNTNSKISIEAEYLYAKAKGIDVKEFKEFSVKVKLLEADYATPMAITPNINALASDKAKLDIDIDKVNFELIDANGLFWGTIHIALKNTTGRINIGELDTKANAVWGAMITLEYFDGVDLDVNIIKGVNNATAMKPDNEIFIGDLANSKLNFTGDFLSTYCDWEVLFLFKIINTEVYITGRYESTLGNAVYLADFLEPIDERTTLDGEFITQSDCTIHADNQAIIKGTIVCNSLSPLFFPIYCFDNSDLQLVDVKLISENTEAIYSPYAISITPLNVYANKAVSAIITQNVGTVKVDALLK